MSLDQYIKSFSRLRTDKNRNRWPALTTYQAPKKYIPQLRGLNSA